MKPGLRRRELLLAMTAVAARPAAGESPASDDRFDGSAFRIPGEFEPLAAIWLGYDAGHEEFTAALIHALHGRVALKMLVQTEADAETARSAWKRRGVAGDDIEYLIEPQAFYFLRDATVFTVGREAAELGAIDFRWTQYGLPGWCQRRHADDGEKAALCEEGVDELRDGLDRAISQLAGARCFESELAMEGGGVECNGQGLLIANQALWTQRNPGLDVPAIERELLRLPGVAKVVWLPEGLAQDPLHRSTIVGQHVAWGTGGHTDEFVRFADPRTVLLAWPEDVDARSHPVARLNRERMQRNLAALQRARGVDGKPLRILKVPLPRIVERRVFLSAAADTAYSAQWTAAFFPAEEQRREGEPVLQVASTSYLNFVIANDLVLLPDYTAHGTPKSLQVRVQRIFEQAFPRREIRFIDAIGANWVGGGAHCATLSEPLPGAGLREARYRSRPA